MKVCFVIPRAYYLFNPDAKEQKDKIGGAQTQTYRLSVLLAKDSRYDVHFVLADFGQEEFEIRKKVKLHKSFAFSDGPAKKASQFFKKLRQIKADIYIFRSADTGVAFALFFVKYILRKKVLYMIAADAETSKSRQRKISGAKTEFAMRKAYHTANALTAQTGQQSAEFFADRGRKPDLILKNIYPEIQIPDLQRDNKNTVLWVGRLAPVKNPEIFINLALENPNIEFVMIAPTVRDFREFGRKTRKSAESVKNIRFHNFVQAHKIREYYNHARIYVMTSEFEGFSNTMAEAMQSECAVLSYKVNPDNILHRHQAGLCASGDLQVFRKNFAHLLSSDNLCEKFGKNAAEYIKKYHSETEILSHFKNLLDKIAR